MNKKILFFIPVLLLLNSQISLAQTTSSSVESLHSVLNQLYSEMIPLAEKLILVARVLAGFAALWFISLRVWGHIARAEAIDLYPLLRPFALGIAITLFPQVLALINELMEPIVIATSEMVEGSNLAVATHLENLENESRQGYYNFFSHGEPGQMPENIDDLNVFERMASEMFSFNLKAMINRLISEFLQILFFAAALCINTIRTFQLLVLSILGPLIFGLSVFDGFHHTLPAWFARYIHVSMWLPVANIFGAIIAKIQLNMLVLDGDFSTSTGYLVFMVIAILGYLTVPNVAGFIVQPGGRDGLLNRASRMAQTGTLALSKFVKP